MFNSISASGLSSTVSTLSGYTTRYYKSANAAAPATWVQTQFTNAAGSANVKTIANTFNQPNVIATIPRKSGSTLNDIIIIGMLVPLTTRLELTEFDRRAS
jgi:leucyl aminopeptidase